MATPSVTVKCQVSLKLRSRITKEGRKSNRKKNTTLSARMKHHPLLILGGEGDAGGSAASSSDVEREACIAPCWIATPL